MDKIAIIGSGVLAKTFAERAHDLGIESHCFSYNRNDVASQSADFFHEIDIFNVDEITRICREQGIKGVLATTELTIYPACQISHRLGLLANDLDVAKNITNKSVTREKVSSVIGLCQPKYSVYQDGELPYIDSFPVIVKPIAAGGKRGVCVVNDRYEMEKAVGEAMKFSKVKGVLIEEYLSGGVEYSVESLSYKGRHYIVQVTQKDTSGPPHCNELGHHQPAKLGKEMRKKVENAISETLEKLDVKNGPCHTEIKIIDDVIYLIEVNGRPGGDHITHPLTELSTGYPIISGIIWAAMGRLEGHEPFNLKSIPCGICFITEETAFLKPLFDVCERYEWCYFKHKVSEVPSKIVYNDVEGLNYFIYYGRELDLSKSSAKIIGE